MRNLDFWLEKYLLASDKLRGLKVEHHVWSNAAAEYDSIKLKKRRGCALGNALSDWLSNRIGTKIGKRRARVLRNRLICLTKAAKARSAIRRLETTKLPFYETQIRKHGGTIPPCW